MSIARILRNPRAGVVVPFVLLFGLWWTSARLGWIDPMILISPGAMGHALLDPEIQRQMAVGLGASIIRLAEGGAIGILVGFLLGLALAFFPTFDRLVGPSFHGFRQIALFAWIPLLTAWLGNGDAAKVAFIALAAFKPVTMGTYEGVRSVPDAYREIGHVFHFRWQTRLLRIVLPCALPAIVAGLQLAIIGAWLGAIGAEYLMGGLSEGIGTLVVGGREMMRMDIVFVGIFIIALIGLALNKVLHVSSRRALAWRGIDD